MKPESKSIDLIVLMPVFNDWPSMQMLVSEIDKNFSAHSFNIRVIAVDDNSIIDMGKLEFGELRSVKQIDVIRLGGNVGHQRAIATGLCWLAKQRSTCPIAVMDSDGEDTPEELVRLIAAHQANPDKVVVARRAKRSESLGFRMSYWSFRCFFRALTGKPIKFGNFMVIPSRWLSRLVHDPNLWSNLAATIISARLPIDYVPTVRGKRYFGKSQMNFVNLVAHGLGAVSVFSEAVFIRICVASLLLFTLAVSAASAVVLIRLFTDLAIPGWTTNVLGFALLMSIQAVIFPLLMIFLLLSSRSTVRVPPKLLALDLIEGVTTVFGKIHKRQVEMAPV